MEKEVGGKINFLQNKIFREIKCVQILALVTLDPLGCCRQLREISHRQVTCNEKQSIYTRGEKNPVWGLAFLAVCCCCLILGFSRD